jgi:hypothetical protein
MIKSFRSKKPNVYKEQICDVEKFKYQVLITWSKDCYEDETILKIFKEQSLKFQNLKKKITRIAVAENETNAPDWTKMHLKRGQMR